jgi:hypothetical protein
VREVLPHASFHLLPGLFEQNGNAENHGKARVTCCQLAQRHLFLWCLAQARNMFMEQQSRPTYMH